MKQNWEKELLALLKEKRIVEYSIKIVKRAKQEERERILKALPKNMKWNGEEAVFETGKAIGFNRCLKQIKDIIN